MAGRYTKRSPEVEQRLFNALQAGSTRRAACQYAGISDEDEVGVRRRRIVYAALAGDQDAWAWLRGEGYIKIVSPKRPARFKRYITGPKRRWYRNGYAVRNWRTAVFQRDGYRCRKCGAPGRLNAHHVQHWATNPSLRFDVDNGISLCVSCHAQEHPKLANFIRRDYHRGKAN